MKTHCKILIVCFCSILTFSVSASDFNYRYFEVGYIRSNIDIGTTDIEGDSLTLSGVFTVTYNTFFSVALQSSDVDYDLDTDLFAIGGGYHMPVTPKSDFVLDAHFLDAQVKAPSFGRSDDNGLSVNAMLRFASTPFTEIYGKIGYLDLYNDSETVVGVGARIKFGGDRSFGVGYTNSDNASDISLSFRMEM